VNYVFCVFIENQLVLTFPIQNFDRKSGVVSKRFAALLERVAGISAEADDWPAQLNKFITTHPHRWWHGVWIACEIKGEPGAMTPAPGSISVAQVFCDARINIAENILGFGPRQVNAITAWAEDGPQNRWSRARLKEMAGRFASGFSGLGLQCGDHVVLNLPDIPEKIAAFLGASWLGLISVLDPPWRDVANDPSSAWREFEPKLILSCDGYRRNGQWMDQADQLQHLIRTFADTAKVIAVPCAGSRIDVQNLSGILPWQQFDRLGKGGGKPFEYVGFDHELAKIPNTDNTGFISIQSGLWLISALQQWRLLLDVQPECHIFNAVNLAQDDWLLGVCVLATGTDIVVYDGDISAMNGQILWRIIEREACKLVQFDADAMAALVHEQHAPMDNHILDRVETVVFERKTPAAQQKLIGEAGFATNIIWHV